MFFESITDRNRIIVIDLYISVYKNPMSSTNVEPVKVYDNVKLSRTIVNPV